MEQGADWEAPPPILRVAGPRDADALLQLARAGGTGLTNLPPNRRALLKRLEASEAAATDESARCRGAGIIFVVNDEAGTILATSAVFPRVGFEWPFYSYRIVRQTRSSRTAERRTEQKLLVLANDFDGEAEVGALFVAPAARHLSIGALAARSRYLFMAKHRAWFGTRVIAELRGWQDADGRSPVWEAVGSHFYNMTLAEADRFGSVRGNQFIADLGPRHPIYTSLLPSAAQSALGKPHDDGRAAYAMLLKEGFCDEGYVDIFDGGPTPVAEINRLATVRNSKVAQFRGVARQADVDALVSAGAGSEFRVLRTNVSFENAELRLPAISARILDVAHGEDLMWSPLDSSRA